MGKPLSEETKKKISEALTKNGPQEPASTPRSAAAQAYLTKFVDKKTEYEGMKNERNALRAKSKALGRKKGSAGQRKALAAEAKKITDKMKVARQTMTAIKKEAQGKKSKQNADIRAQKAAFRVTQYDAAINKIKSALSSVQDPKRKERMQAQLDRATKGRDTANSQMKEQAAVATGKAQPKKSSTFDFCGHDHRVHLFAEAGKKIKLPRELTLQEKRIDWQALNEAFDDVQGELEDDLLRMTSDEIDRVVQNVQNKLDAGDLASLGALAFLFRGKVKASVRAATIKAYGVGKDAAAKELGISTPSTPLRDTQIIAADAANTSEAFTDALEQVARAAAIGAMSVGASNAATTSYVRRALEEEAARGIINTSGTVVGQYVNRGRGTVLFDNVTKISAFQRSEVLDSRTCAMCLSLDERVVKADDPMAKMESVHTHCRGVWVPIFVDDVEKPEIGGIPKSIMEAFETVDGRPVVNSFKQLKRPLNSVSKPAAEIIRQRLAKAK